MMAHEKMSLVKKEQAHNSPGHVYRVPVSNRSLVKSTTSVTRRHYINEDMAYQLVHAVNFVSPVTAGNPAPNEQRFIQGYASPGTLPEPASEGNKPYLPYRSTRNKNLSKSNV